MIVRAVARNSSSSVRSSLRAHERYPNCFSNDMPAAEARVRPAATGGEGETSGRKHTALAFLAIVVALASGWLWNSRRNQAVGNAGEGTRVKTYLHLETFVLNLEDPEQRSYLRIGIDLGLRKEPGSG